MREDYEVPQELSKKYNELLKKTSTEDIGSLLSILYCHPAWIMSSDNFENLEENKKVKLRDMWSKLFMFDRPKHDQLLETLRTEYCIYEEDYGLNVFSQKAPFSKLTYLIEIAEPLFDLRNEGKEIPDDQKIISIHCFISEHSDKDYKIVINEDYSSKPFKVSKSTKSWAMMIELIKNGYLNRDKETKKLYDYFNFNKNNLITKNSKYPLQIIIEQNADTYSPKFKGTISTEKTLIQRQNKYKF